MNIKMKQLYLTVGIYHQPHMQKFNERPNLTIREYGEEITEKFLETNLISDCRATHTLLRSHDVISKRKFRILINPSSFVTEENKHNFYAILDDRYAIRVNQTHNTQLSGNLDYSQHHFELSEELLSDGITGGKKFVEFVNKSIEALKLVITL